MTHDDRSLDTETAAPPPAPPRRPIVGAAMADDDFLSRLQEQARQLAALRDQCDAILTAHRAACERLR
jgi:hypothetical protein